MNRFEEWHGYNRSLKWSWKIENTSDNLRCSWTIFARVRMFFSSFRLCGCCFHWSELCAKSEHGTYIYPISLNDNKNRTFSMARNAYFPSKSLDISFYRPFRPIRKAQQWIMLNSENWHITFCLICSVDSFSLGRTLSFSLIHISPLSCQRHSTLLIFPHVRISSKF